MVPLARGAIVGILRRNPCMRQFMMDAPMDADDARRRETEALIEAIWGAQAVTAPAPPDPATRAAQNRALAEAMRAYLQQYLADE